MVSESTPCPLCQSTSWPLWGGERATSQCTGCGVVWTIPPQSHETPEERWSEEYYERCYLPRAEALTADFARQLQALGEHVSGETWLDVGCGGGYFAAAATAAGWRVTGVDPSSEALRLAGRVCPEGRFVHGGPDALPDGEQFDAMSFWDSLFVIPDLPTALAAYLKHLRPGGSLVIKTVHRPPRLHRMARAVLGWYPALRDDAACVRHACWHFTPESLSAFLRLQGLETVTHRWADEVPVAEETGPASLKALAGTTLRGLVRASIGPHESFLLVARKPALAGDAARTSERAPELAGV